MRLIACVYMQDYLCFINVLVRVEVVLKRLPSDSHFFFEIDKLDENDDDTQTYLYIK